MMRLIISLLITLLAGPAMAQTVAQPGTTVPGDPSSPVAGFVIPAPSPQAVTARANSVMSMAASSPWIDIEVKGSRHGGKTDITVKPTDPEWAQLQTIIQTIAARRAAGN